MWTGPAMEVSIPKTPYIALDAEANVYLTDQGESSVRKLDAANQISFYAGHLNALGYPTYGMDDGPASTATFSTPSSIALDSAGVMYIADYGRIRTIDKDAVVRTIAGSDNFGQVDGTGPAASLPPSEVSLAAAPDGSVYFIQSLGDRIRKVTPDGTVSTIASTAVFQSLRAIAVGNDNNIYVADATHIRKVSPHGEVTTVFEAPPRKGCGLQDMIGPGPTLQCPTFETPVNGPREVATLASAVSLALDSKGNLFIADRSNGMVRVMSPEGGLSTLAGTGEKGSTDGPGSSAQLTLPVAVATDKNGNVYFAETGLFWGPSGTMPKLRKITLQ